jgi:glutamate N-acetyltransferase/amino-acid N-acetyltransferase
VTVTTPSGFRAAGVAAGLVGPHQLDLALVVNDGPGELAAGVFTRHPDPAAPVLWSRQVLTWGRLRAVAVNSGGANSGTGPAGFQTAHAVAEQVGESLEVGAVEVAIGSVGPFGVAPSREALLAGVKSAAAALDTGPAAATRAAAALAPGHVPVQAAHRHAAGWSVGGLVCGPGAMFAVLTTDADVDRGALEAALVAAAGPDAGCEPSDTVLVLCSAASGVRTDGAALARALTEVFAQLTSNQRGAQAG